MGNQPPTAPFLTPPPPPNTTNTTTNTTNTTNTMEKQNMSGVAADEAPRASGKKKGRRPSYISALDLPEADRIAPAKFDKSQLMVHNVSMSLPLFTTTDHTCVGVVEEILAELTEHDPCRGIFANTLMMLTGNESWA